MLQPKEFLYHGTVFEITKIDVSKGKERKDFGKGFYLAENKTQAIGMMHKKHREQIHRNSNHAKNFREYLYEIKLDVTLFDKLKIKTFEKADFEWLEFILMNREKGGLQHDYDLVIGPTADDNTNLCLRTYWDGFYGKVGSKEAKQILLNNLEVENLGTQYFIGKQSVADKLIVSIKEISWS